MIFTEILRKSRNTKQKRVKLQAMLDERNIPYIVEYVRGIRPGWYISPAIANGESKSRIGLQFYSAKELIQKGTLQWLVDPLSLT